MRGNFLEELADGKVLTKSSDKRRNESGSRSFRSVESLPSSFSLAAVCLLATLLAGLISAQAPQLDLLAFAQLEPALRDMGLPEGITHTSRLLSQSLSWTGLFLVCLGATLSARKLPPSTSFVVILQIFVVGLLYQIAFFSLLEVKPIPVGYLLGCALGAFGGVWLKSREREKKLMEAQFYELYVRNRELEEARIALVKQDEVERRLLAADLHDQVLNDMKKILESFRKLRESPDQAEKLAGQIESGFQKTMTEVREIMDDLCPVMLSNFGMAPAIEDCLEKGSERGEFIPFFESSVEEEELERFSQVEQSLIYRLVQESVTNICKHANASEVAINLEKQKGNLVVTITDDGKGIDYASISHLSRGLRYMRLRADLINGTIDWSEAPSEKKKGQGPGTMVRITVPFPPSPTQDSV